MLRETTAFVDENSETVNEYCKNDENAAKHFQTVSSSIENTNVDSSLKSQTKIVSLDLTNRFRRSIKEQKCCPDCGQTWNGQHQQIHEMEFLCLSPSPELPELLPSPTYFRDATPSPQCNRNFDTSTSDYESSLEFRSSDDSHASELERSCESLPSINWSITDDGLNDSRK